MARATSSLPEPLSPAIRTVLPVLGNQVVAMFKETSLLSTITVIELLAEASRS